MNSDYEKKQLPRFHPKRVLILCLNDALGLAGSLFLVLGVLGLLKGTVIVPVGTMFKWAGIAFLIGFVTGLRNI